jgi:peptide deformylase
VRIKHLGHPILREVSKPISVDDIHSEQIQSLLSTMKAILNGIKAISDENGNALSAPQSGLAVRLILLRVNGEFMPMFNPQIIAKSDATFLFDEECFSFYSLRAKVQRFQRVTVSYQDEKAVEHQVELEGEFAGLVQHEIDHLDGIFFLDRVENNQSIQSVDHLLSDNPKRLTTVRAMMAYMADPAV